MSRPRQLKESREFYERWSAQVFTFCRLLCGEQAKAELCTEQTFILFFRFADCMDLDSYSQIPVSLLRFASDVAEIHCQEPLRADATSRDQAVLALLFKEHAAFILVSVLRVRRSAAAIALRLSREQLKEYWMQAALHLRRLWLSTGESGQEPG